MNRKITKSDLQKIRKEIIAVNKQGDGKDKDRTIIATIVLPEPCDSETALYARILCERLREVHCEAQISGILHHPFRAVSDKDYEVMKNVPLGTPCIRVYPKPPFQERKKLKSFVSHLAKRCKKLLSDTEKQKK